MGANLGVRSFSFVRCAWEGRMVVGREKLGFGEILVEGKNQKR